MDVQRPHRLYIAPASLRRLTFFTAASIALHALTLAAYVPAGAFSSTSSGRAVDSALHATLTPVETSSQLETASSEPQPTGGVEQESSAQSTQDSPSKTPDALASATPRAGAPGGFDLPTPDKWFTAQELDVRAEPLTPADLVYPQELMRSAAVGQVRILLFIDEHGIVRKSQIAAGASEALFDEAATNAWKNVRFSPAEKNGVAVKSQKLLQMEFLPF